MSFEDWNHVTVESAIVNGQWYVAPLGTPRDQGGWVPIGSVTDWTEFTNRVKDLTHIQGWV